MNESWCFANNLLLIILCNYFAVYLSFYLPGYLSDYLSISVPVLPEAGMPSSVKGGQVDTKIYIQILPNHLREAKNKHTYKRP